MALALQWSAAPATLEAAAQEAGSASHVTVVLPVGAGLPWSAVYLSTIGGWLDHETMCCNVSQTLERELDALQCRAPVDLVFGSPPWVHAAHSVLRARDYRCAIIGTRDGRFLAGRGVDGLKLQISRYCPARVVTQPAQFR